MDNTSFDEGFAGNATSAGNIQSGAERSVVLLCPTTCPTRTPLWAGIKEVGHKVFGGYAELLRIPHTARYSIGSVIACMPFPMVGMTITISVQHYYGNYSLAGMLTAIQAIALAVATPLLGKLTDKFGQRQVSIPTILVWIVAARRADHIHHQSCAGMGAVLFDAVPGSYSAVGAR